MSAGFIKVPIGFARRADVRLFTRQLQAVCDRWDGAACAFHIWMEFAEVGMDWRPLRLPFGGDPERHDWGQEEITFLIESAANWQGKPGVLIRSGIEAGLLRIVSRGDVAGLVLNGFAELNEHLLPGYVSMQKRGGLAAGEARKRKADVAAAQQQRRLMESKNAGEELPLVIRGEATTPEVEAGIQLIMHIDRACGHETRRTSEYDDGLVTSAVGVTRAFTAEQIEAVLLTLAAGRDNPMVIKRADFVLDHFGEYMRSTQNVPHRTI